MSEHCIFCGTSVETDRRPYVCHCGASFGKRGWLRPVIVAAKRHKTEEEKARDRIASYRRVWAKLHSCELGDLEFVQKTLAMLLKSCSCRKQAENILQDHPPRYGTPDEWFLWTVSFHNLVNEKLGKPLIEIDRAKMLWRNQRPENDRTRAIVTVANGPEHVEMLKLTIPFMRTYADKCNADLIDLDNDTESWGFMEKFRAYHFANQYREVLFLDVDCVVKPNAPNIFEEFTEDICICDDYERLRKQEWITEERKLVAARSNTDIQDLPQCLNSGVVLSRRNACDIWKRPEVDIGTTHWAEQIWLEHQIVNSVTNGSTFRSISHQWNWQWWFSAQDNGSFEAGLADAWIVHFANAPDRLQLIGDYINTL